MLNEDQLLTLHSFSGSEIFRPPFRAGNANFPSLAVVQGSDGGLYRVQTTIGGTVCRVHLGLTAPAPFVTAFSTNIGVAGANVITTGTQLLGAAAVSFDGALAQFEVVSAHSIVAPVPAAATTGSISVTTPHGASTSKVRFKVVAH